MQSLIREERAKIIALVALIILTTCIGSLSQTALNTMLVQVAADLSVSIPLAQWATTIYMLVLGMVVPVVPFLMRRFPLKGIVLASIALLLAGALLDFFAQNLAMLIAGRVLQAISSGVTLPMMMSVVVMRFPPNRRATVLGFGGIAMGFAPNIGPSVGSLMLDAWGWRSFFLAMMAVAVVLYLFSVLLVDYEPAESSDARFDVPSLVQSTLGFGGLLLGFSNASNFALGDPFVWLPVVVGAVFLVLFLLRQRRIEHPLIHLEVMESRAYRIGFWAMNLLWASFMCVTLVIPLFVLGPWGGTVADAGMAMLAGALVTLVGNPLAGLVADRFGTRPVVTFAVTCLAVASLGMVPCGEGMPLLAIVLLQGLRQVGVSCLIGPTNAWMMHELEPRHISDGSSFTTAIRQAIASLATALAVFLVTFVPAVTGVEILGYQAAFGLSALCALGVAVLVYAKVR